MEQIIFFFVFYTIIKHYNLKNFYMMNNGIINRNENSRDAANLKFTYKIPLREALCGTIIQVLVRIHWYYSQLPQ